MKTIKAQGLPPEEQEKLPDYDMVLRAAKEEGMREAVTNLARLAGKARQASMTPQERKEHATRAIEARWAKDAPERKAKRLQQAKDKAERRANRIKLKNEKKLEKEKKKSQAGTRGPAKN